MKKIYFLILFGINITLGYTQITQIEVASGFNKSGITHFSSLQASSKLGININTLAFFQKYHRTEDTFLNESGLQLSILKKLTQNFFIGPTLYYNSFAGMMENVTLSYVKSNANYTLIVAPSIGYSNKQKSMLGEVYFQGEYRVPLVNEWHLVSYLQMLTNWIKIKTHDRSFQKIRVGVSKNNWQFGAAADFDYYGPSSIKKRTLGFFLRKVIIN